MKKMISHNYEIKNKNMRLYPIIILLPHNSDLLSHNYDFLSQSFGFLSPKYDFLSHNYDFFFL